MSWNNSSFLSNRVTAYASSRMHRHFRSTQSRSLSKNFLCHRNPLVLGFSTLGERSIAISRTRKVNTSCIYLRLHGTKENRKTPHSKRRKPHATQRSTTTMTNDTVTSSCFQEAKPNHSIHARKLFYSYIISYFCSLSKLLFNVNFKYRLVVQI